jgi:hypothetical protein
MKQLKLGTKLLMGGLLVLAIPIIVIGIVSVYQASESTFKEKKEDMNVISESLAGALEVGMYEEPFLAQTVLLPLLKKRRKTVRQKVSKRLSLPKKSSLR